ncbi:PaaI family thioesterase [Primorskyibacter sp. S187A]|uniref:PaaI family thioesterase n=1 Tax=Primorskyibacter sp. S187A TaxID=3415130 RepID=UPI003C7DC845
MGDTDGAAWESPYPFASHIGMDLTSWTRDFARIELPIVPHIGNRHGIPHGGVHASLLDTCMGYAGCFTGDPEARRYCLTLNLSVNYIGRPEGARLIAEGRRTGGGAKTFFAEGRLVDELGTLVASSTGVFRYVSAPQGETTPVA